MDRLVACSVLRFVAGLLVLIVGMGGAIPRWTAFRCFSMQSISSRSCCADAEIDDDAGARSAEGRERSIRRACCEAFEAPTASRLMLTRESAPEIAPAQGVALLPL